ncbi:nuclear transport factor 2 family protein [Nocardia sp. XZ_19_369]|uniref:nuclear transport factor 2 family protein n=1 Tax=Nocardia sp. XZ_19_369 TaxID=2769487 RepID=UPI001E34C60F|nr:nuclear transport factor 2 family protein [Nocardia sp. XZ_19_369]
MISMTTAPLDRRRVGNRSTGSAGLPDAAVERAALERFYELLFLQDHEQVLDLVTDDVLFHAPWQLPGLPTIIEGRAELHESMLWWSTELWSPGSLSRITVRPFATAHAWLAKVEGEFTALESERLYHAMVLSEVRFDGGAIAEVRQYHNTLNQIIALGADVPGINVPGYGVGSNRGQDEAVA